ncbi:MAG: DUF3006 domain-containing protein [Oscillospiraceae bacterium]|nr:DUF3006 domain-containing protein [Oscillospiraceae bacterium]MDE5883835.1 DUF3006 domain-containing protein [Oscillospiraceae bacterium]
MKYRTDRFEGEFAILEYDTESGQAFISVLKTMLPEYLKEGDILEFTGTDWKLCRDETESRRQTLAERRRRLLKIRNQN